MKALIIANGEPPSWHLVTKMAAAADLVLAADGGVDKALGAGIKVDAVVGDFDSASLRARRLLPAGRFYLRDDPSQTDLEKTVDFAMEKGATEVDVVCGGGGRLDHLLANIAVLRVYRGRVLVRLVDDMFEVSLIEGRVEFEAPVGTVISLMAIGTCTGVTTHGLRWDLSDYTFEFSTVGVHNEVASNPASVEVVDGDLLLLKGSWVERHL